MAVFVATTPRVAHWLRKTASIRFLVPRSGTVGGHQFQLTRPYTKRPLKPKGE